MKKVFKIIGLAAEELSLPIIIQFAQRHEPWSLLETIGPIMVEIAKFFSPSYLMSLRKNNAKKRLVNSSLFLALFYWCIVRIFLRMAILLIITWSHIIVFMSIFSELPGYTRIPVCHPKVYLKACCLKFEIKQFTSVQISDIIYLKQV